MWDDGWTGSNNICCNTFALCFTHMGTISPSWDPILGQASYVWYLDTGMMFCRIPCLNKNAPDVYGRKQNDQVEVELDMDILDISSLDVVEEEISFEINLIESWIDTRCRYEVNEIG